MSGLGCGIHGRLLRCEVCVTVIMLIGRSVSRLLVLSGIYLRHVEGCV
jgi:hypothetical protein